MKIARVPQRRNDRLALTLDLSLFHLEAGELPGLRCAAGHEPGPVLLLLIGEVHRRLATAAAGGLLDGGVDLESRRIRNHSGLYR